MSNLEVRIVGKTKTKTDAKTLVRDLFDAARWNTDSVVILATIDEPQAVVSAGYVSGLQWNVSHSSRQEAEQFIETLLKAPVLSLKELLESCGMIW